MQPDLGLGQRFGTEGTPRTYCPLDSSRSESIINCFNCSECVIQLTITSGESREEVLLGVY